MADLGPGAVWYGNAGLWIVPAALAVGVGSTFLASLYPSYIVHRLDLSETIRAS
jgi:ABC-type lipoprotein release transport system permease subunit